MQGDKTLQFVLRPGVFTNGWGEDDTTCHTVRITFFLSGVVHVKTLRVMNVCLAISNLQQCARQVGRQHRMNSVLVVLFEYQVLVSGV
jgi:hypothetical protein